MPTTSTGESVYAEPSEVEGFVQTQPENFGKSTDTSQDGVGEWREFIEARQIEAKSHIDEFCGRDFEDHPGDTVTLDGAAGSTALYAPAPIRSVQSVESDGTALESGSWTFKPTGMLIRTRGEWPDGYQNVVVTMDWGYESPPGDIATAEKKLVSNALVGMSQKREGMVVDAGDVSARINLPAAMTTEIRNMLDGHQRSKVFV